MARRNYGKIKGPKSPEQIKKQQKIVTVIIGVCAIAAMGSMLVIPKMIAGTKEQKPQVAVAAVEQGDITSLLDTSGTVVSLNTKTYFSPVNAALKQYNLKVGDVVKKNDMLVAFETDTLEQDNQKAELSASATINNNKDALEKANQTIADAQTAAANIPIIEGDISNFKAYISDLNQAISDRTRELTEQAGAEMASSASAQSQQLADLSQAYSMATQKEALETANEQLTTEVENLTIQQSQAQYDGDATTAEIIGKQIDDKNRIIKDGEKQIEKFRTKMGDYADSTAAELEEAMTALSSEGGAAQGTGDPSTDAQIAQWQMDLADAQSTLAELQGDLATAESEAKAGDSAQMTQAAREAMNSNNNMAELETMTVTQLLDKGRKGIQADFDGIVTKAELVQGTLASQGMELITVASNREVAVEATVSKYDYDKLQKGQKADITIGNNNYKGTVESISKVAQQNEKGSPIISCEVKVDNPDDDIFLGVEAKVSITTASVKDVIMVPINAVNTGKDSTFCYIVENGVIVKKDVETGVSSTEYMEIKSGLKPGDNVIPELPEGFTEGMEVEASDSPAGAMGMPAAGMAAAKE